MEDLKLAKVFNNLNARIISNVDDSTYNEFDKWMKINPVRSEKDIWSWGWDIIRLWMHNKGVYTIPTTELNDFIFSEFFPEDEWSDERMDDEVLEIAAGTGMLGRMLNIRMTDNYLQQDNKEVAMYYDLLGQPRIKYPSDVIKMDANKSVVVYHPHTIIGSYVTWGSKSEHDCANLGANYYGPDMMDLYSKVSRIILIGNESILSHTTNPILRYSHKVYDNVPGLITRSNPSKNRIWVWNKN